jgi:hypothetical protein
MPATDYHIFNHVCAGGGQGDGIEGMGINGLETIWELVYDILKESFS